MQHQSISHVDKARSLSDEFARHPHSEPIAQAIDELRTVLWQIDEELLGEGTLSDVLCRLEGAIGKLADVADSVVPDLRQRAYGLLQSAHNVKESLTRELPSREIPSRQLFGLLPLKRVVPQDLHSVTDYAAGLKCIGAGFLANTEKARVASMTLGASLIAVSLLTDDRLGAIKVIPIEAHEIGDYVWGASCMALPFVLGYSKKDPVVTAMHFIGGATMILVSLFTDYRAARGVGRRWRERGRRIGGVSPERARVG